jgi:hypothetical protein
MKFHFFSKLITFGFYFSNELVVFLKKKLSSFSDSFIEICCVELGNFTGEKITSLKINFKKVICEIFLNSYFTMGQFTFAPVGVGLKFKAVSTFVTESKLALSITKTLHNGL